MEIATNNFSLKICKKKKYGVIPVDQIDRQKRKDKRYKERELKILFSMVDFD
jgi:hypothetical protein